LVCLLVGVGLGSQSTLWDRVTGFKRRAQALHEEARAARDNAARILDESTVHLQRVNQVLSKTETSRVEADEDLKRAKQLMTDADVHLQRVLALQGQYEASIHRVYITPEPSYD